MQNQMSNKKRNIRKVPLIALAALLAVGVVFVVVIILIFIKIRSDRTVAQNHPASNAQTTSMQPSAQNTFSSGGPRKEATQSDLNEGTVTDNNGVITNTPAENTWSKSPDGSSIIVYTPAQNQVLLSGQTISGSATVSRVNFRLIDNLSGVIAQGSIDVTNGKFSGTFNFSTAASEGRVDVYTANAEGVESNNVAIPVRFK